MKRIGILLVLCLVFSACNEIGIKLEGKWQMKTVEHENGLVESVDTIYYNFMSTLFSYQYYISATGGFSRSGGWRTMIDDDTMILEFKQAGDFGNVKPEDFIKNTDWEDVKREFSIVKLTNKTLILKSEGKTYTFHSF